MADPTFSTVASCIPVETAHQQQLLKRAKEILTERGQGALIEDLSRPVQVVPSELLPYLSLALHHNYDYPLTLESTSVLERPTATYPTSVLTSNLHFPLLRSTCRAVDGLLGGGLPVGTGAIFEISGKAGVGKTQLAAQLALMAPAPRAHGGLQTPSIHAFTEGRLPLRRMAEIDRALTNQFSLAPSSLLKCVVAEKLTSSDELLRWAEERLPYLLRETNARLVVIDSVTAVYRPDFDDPISRADHLGRMATALRQAVAAVRGVCVCVNQVSQTLDGLNSLSTTVPALGPIWSNCVSTRLFLNRVKERRFIRVTHSSYLPTTAGSGNSFIITRDGVVDRECDDD